MESYGNSGYAQIALLNKASLDARNNNFEKSLNNFQKLDSLTHEIVGLLAYRITGRTKTLFPNLNLIPVHVN